MRMIYSDRVFLILVQVLLLFPATTYSHPGSLDADSGHHNRNTNVYHYHHSKSQPHPQVSSSAYNRSDWPHWVDADDDCQNTRAEILIRDSIVPVKFKRNKPCNVSWGRWICPYTGKEFTKASDMDIDHIIPLSHAHRTGEASWSREKKREFVSDPLNLIAVEDNINQEKGDKSPDEWKPPRKAYWGEYARKWKAVEVKYGLVINDAGIRVLAMMKAVD